MRISDWSSDVCSSDLAVAAAGRRRARAASPGVAGDGRPERAGAGEAGAERARAEGAGAGPGAGVVAAGAERAGDLRRLRRQGLGGAGAMALLRDEGRRDLPRRDEPLRAADEAHPMRWRGGTWWGVGSRGRFLS